MKKIYLLALLPLLVACGSPSESVTTGTDKPSDTTTVADFSIVGPTKVDLGDVVTYSVDKNIPVTWSSTDPDVLEINSKGEAVSYKTGDVTITATDSENRKATLEVSVEKELMIPADEMGMSALFQTVYEQEQLANEFTFLRTDTSIQQTLNLDAKLYDENFFIETSDEEYTNYAGETKHIQETHYKGLEEDYYTEINDSTEKGSAFRMKVVEENPSDYEISREDAIEKASIVGYAHTFYLEMSEMWTNERTLDLQIESEETEDGFQLHLTNYYLFVWANGVSNDCRGYDAILDVSNDGFLKSATFTTTTYEESQWDVNNNKLVENAKIQYTSSITYGATRGDKFAASTSDFKPGDYFVTSVTKATFNENNPVKIGDQILANKIVIEEYKGEKALDLDYFVITGVEDKVGENVIVYDPINGKYLASSEGQAQLTCTMLMSENVTFHVDVTVTKA